MYQASRPLGLAEALQLEPMLEEFVANWKSHGADVKAYGNLFFGRFVVLMADETQSGVSGCSTDSSVRFMKQVGEALGIDFFNRTNLAFYRKEKIEVLPMNQLSYAAENGFITADTLYFNNLVQTKEELENNWIIPVRSSWLMQRLPSLT